MMRKPAILVVDDMTENIHLVAAILGENTYTIAFAQNGRQALEKAAELIPDIILMDIVMPDISGYEVCRELKKNPDTRDIPVIFLSGLKTGFDDILTGFQAGCADYIIKPFNPAELNARVRTHLELKFRTEALLASEKSLKKAHEEARLHAAELEKANQQLIRENEKRSQTEKELLRYQARLRSMTAELVLTGEQERRRAAVEIHESIGQLMGMVKIRLGVLKKDSGMTPALKEKIEEILAYIEQSIRDVRSVSYDLSPPILYEMGLEAALRSFIAKIREKHGMDIEFNDDGQEKYLDNPTRIHLFRCIQELIFNIIRHARARHMKISVCRNQDEIHIRVKDDGCGFDSSLLTFHPDASRGFGLFSVRERMMHLGGHFEIHSEPGKGSEIFLSTRLGKPNGITEQSNGNQNFTGR